MKEIKEILVTLFRSVTGHEPLSITRLPGSGSYRTYYRMQAGGVSVIGAHNEDRRENEAFISFTRHFRKEGLPVPEILACDPANRVYLITDLGDTTLFGFLAGKRGEPGSSSGFTGGITGEARLTGEVMEIYKKALSWLTRFQVTAGKGLDYTLCYPRAAFDRQSMMWDLNYFKYYFLRLARIPFDEQKLEDDFTALCDLLLRAGADFFLYRDFQSRNIMVLDGEPWFIDYQGGRRGALQYDVASLLTDAKADLPLPDRDEMLRFYLDALREVSSFDTERFLEHYHAFVLIRVLQALGAYGFRGYYENKPHFLRSIPYALRNLRFLRSEKLIGFNLDALMQVIDTMIETSSLYDLGSPEATGRAAPATDSLQQPAGLLKVTIRSFSYRNGIPPDQHGHGGGFVFDCRALPNPGRSEAFRDLTGKDKAIAEYLEIESSVNAFLEHVFALVISSIEAYNSRGFEHLSVSFGCTGGRHRSVYCAERLAEHLSGHYPVSIELFHNELLPVS